jgi:hypothetical protein
LVETAMANSTENRDNTKGEGICLPS